MKHKNRQPRRTALKAQSILLGMLTVAASFALGVQTAGDIETVQRSSAEDTVLTGDIDGDGSLSLEDAILLLEFAQSEEQPSQRQLQADPDGNGALTVEDAILLLEQLALNR